MTKEKQTIKRLTFTEDEAEQALLAAAEAQVAAGDFPVFADLCKAALQAFLKPAPVSPQPVPVGIELVETRLAQIEQALVTLQAGQQTLYTLVEHNAVHTTPVALQPDPMLERLSQQMHALQNTQQARHAELQQVLERMTGALAELQAAAPVNGFHKQVVNPTPSTNDIAVSAATVNRLARFLEDF